MPRRMKDSQRKAMFARLNTLRHIPAPRFEANKLPVQVAIIVPRTTDKDKDLTPQQFSRRVSTEKKWMNSTFGGSTTVKGRGSFNDGKKLINEDVKIVEISTTRRSYIRHLKKFENHAVKRVKDWKQDSVFVRVEGQSFNVPKRGYIDHDKGQSNKILIS